jgi:hypothetical protein
MAKRDFEPNKLFWDKRDALGLTRPQVADIANQKSVMNGCGLEPLNQNYIGRVEQGRIGGGMCDHRREALCLTLQVDDPAKIGLVAERRRPTRSTPARRRADRGVVGNSSQTIVGRRPLSVKPLSPQDDCLDKEDPLAPLERLAALTDAEFTDDKIANADRIIAGFIDEYETQGPRELGPRVRRQRERILRGLTGFERPRHVAALYRQSAQLAGMLAYMAVNVGDFRLARAYCTEAFGLAEFAQDMDLCAWVRGTESFCAYYEGDYRWAVELAREGLQLAGGGPQTIRLLVNGEARALAKLGDDLGAKQAIEGAFVAAARHGVRDGMSPCLSFGPYSDARTTANAITAYTSLGDRGKVQEFLSELAPVVDSSSSVWSMSLTRLDLATVLLAEDSRRSQKPDPEAAAELAVQALTISAERPITSVMTRAREVHTGVSAWSNIDSVRLLGELLNECATP